MKGGPWGRSLLGWLAALATFGCLSPPWAPYPGPCPVGLVATDDLPQDLRMRLRMRLDFDHQELHLETIADRVSEGIIVVGLAPYGIRVFAVRQRGREAEVETPSRALEKIGLWTLDALHRAYWIEPPRRAATDPSRWIREGERVSDWRQDGRLLRREFASTDRARAHTVVSIDYAAADADASEPGIRVRNPWCGYEALLITPESSDAKATATSAGLDPTREGEQPP